MTTLADPLVIRRPRLRFLNLCGASAASLLASDKNAFSDLFQDSEETSTVTSCDVLILYVDVTGDGRALADLVRQSGAPIVVVASENPGDAYIAASRSDPHKYTNLVLTIARNGPSFERFFHALFQKMFAGTTMPMAWVELAPQIPGYATTDAPETIFACGAGHIRFEA